MWISRGLHDGINITIFSHFCVLSRLIRSWFYRCQDDDIQMKANIRTSPSPRAVYVLLAKGSLGSTRRLACNKYKYYIVFNSSFFLFRLIKRSYNWLSIFQQFSIWKNVHLLVDLVGKLTNSIVSISRSKAIASLQNRKKR